MTQLKTHFIEILLVQGLFERSTARLTLTPQNIPKPTPTPQKVLWSLQLVSAVYLTNVYDYFNKGCFFSDVDLNVVAMLHTTMKLNSNASILFIMFCHFNIYSLF